MDTLLAKPLYNINGHLGEGMETLTIHSPFLVSISVRGSVGHTPVGYGSKPITTKMNQKENAIQYRV